MQATVGTIILFSILFLVISVIVGAIVVHVAARLANAPHATFKRAVKAVI